MKIFNGVEKLIVGKVYTYPQLCELFGEDRKSGNSKIAQLNEWECYFRWTKINAQQYRIEEVYDIPKERIDKRKKNSGKATGKFYEIDDLLMEFLEEEEKKTVETTVPKLAVELGIMSEQYNTHRRNYKEFAENNDLSYEFILTFFDNVRSVVHRAIERAIERLDKEGYVQANGYYNLILTDYSRQKMLVEEMRAYEEEALSAMKIHRYSLGDLVTIEQFKKNVHSLILQYMGISVLYSYKEFSLTKTKKKYCSKTHKSKEHLTRKLVYSIVWKMINYAYRKANQVYGEIPIVEDDGYYTHFNVDVISADYEEAEIKKMLEDIVTLSNYFFIYMNQKTWEAYWEDEKLGSDDKSLVFMSEILIGVIEEAKRKREDNSSVYDKDVTPKHTRDEAIAGLGLEDVEEIERILPDIDWELVWEDEDYLKRYADALFCYYEAMYMFEYSKEEYVEEYCLYIARLASKTRLNRMKCKNGIEGQMHFYDFVHQLDENDMRYETLQ